MTEHLRTRNLSLATDTRNRLPSRTGQLGRHHLRLLRVKGNGSLLDSLGGLCLLLGRLDGLLALCVADPGLLVPLEKDFSERGADNGTLELLGLAGLLLRLLLLLALSVLAPIQHSPSRLTGVPIHQVRPLTLGVQKLQSFSVYLDQGLATTRVDLEAAVVAQCNLHCGVELGR